MRLKTLQISIPNFKSYTNLVVQMSEEVDLESPRIIKGLATGKTITIVMLKNWTPTIWMKKCNC